MDIQEHDDVDLINHLPEEIISLILSRMPTRDAVRTSVLSRAWQYKWTCITSVQIHDQESSDPHNEDTALDFVNFVQRVVDQTHNVTSFCLATTYNYPGLSTELLIGAILRHPVKNLDLNISRAVIPNNLIQNTSLEILKLRFDCIFRIPGTATFPKLKSLYLFGADFENNSSNDHPMTLYLPLVEAVELTGCIVNVTMMEIHAPVLTTFDCTYPIGNSVHKIKIISEKPVLFTHIDGNNCKMHEKFIIVGQQIVQAEFDYCDYKEHIDGWVQEHVQTMLTQSLSNVRELTISDDLLKIILSPTVVVTVPLLLHLVRLYVNNDYEDDHLTRGLLKLLDNAPCLKFLRITCFGRRYKYRPVPAEAVPFCIKNRLEEIEFKLNFKWRKRSGLHLLKFLMANGRALKRIYIHCDDPDDCDDQISVKKMITQSLLAIPRSSTELLNVQFI